jgi:hypothetical protein
MKNAKRREFFKTGIAAMAAACLIECTGKVQAQEKPSTTSNSKEFSPGQKVPASGIYEVTHDKLDGDDHAPKHQVTLIAGTVFPCCKVCGEWVRFRLLEAAEHVETVTHFVR